MMYNTTRRTGQHGPDGVAMGHLGATYGYQSIVAYVLGARADERADEQRARASSHSLAVDGSVVVALVGCAEFPPSFPPSLPPSLARSLRYNPAMDFSISVATNIERDGPWLFVVSACDSFNV